jgi:enamine deaminase RidA (YjgF/YER057c/UK114 family)
MDRRGTVPRQEPTPQPAPSENVPDNKPARTTVEVMLKSPDLLVEITVTACIPD